MVDCFHHILSLGYLLANLADQLFSSELKDSIKKGRKEEKRTNVYRFLNLELNTRRRRGSTRAVRQIVVKSLVEFISIMPVR